MAGFACSRDEQKILQCLQDSLFSDAGRSLYISSKTEAGDIALTTLSRGENGNCEKCFLCQFSL